MPNVIVAKKPTIKLTLNNGQAVGGINRLDHLTDVDASAEANGATLVYDSFTDKYVVKLLDFSGDIDGGTF